MRPASIFSIIQLSNSRELALQNDWGNYTVDDYLRSFAIRPYGEDIPYKTEAMQDTKQEPAPGKSNSQKTE